jgi:hypothetical protein
MPIRNFTFCRSQHPTGLTSALLLLISACFSIESALAGERLVTVYHKDVVMTYVPVNRDSGQAALGDVRVANAQLEDKSGHIIGAMNGTLTTIALNTPKPDDEIRSSNLVFRIGRAQNQLVVGGQSDYPSDSATISPSSTTIRPITGGSGKYAGARGWAKTIHYANGSWKHVFHLMP